MSHTLVAMRGSARWSAECSCGWRSTPVWRRQEADARWHIHESERRAATCITVGIRLRATTAARMLELVELRSATASRRLALRERRWQLRSSRADGLHRAHMLPAVEPAPWQVLNRARSFLGVSVSALWLEYFIRGGVATYDEFAEMLTGIRSMTMHDYDLAAGVLNESFRDAGLGAPVANAEGVLQAPLVGLQP